MLLVDDDEVNLLLTSIALRERGFDVTEATSGEQAIRTAGRLAARRRRARRADARPRRLRDLPRAARAARLRVAAGADADRPGRRRLDHPRLRGRRHRLLRQVAPSGACWPGGCATCCARRARGSSSSAASRSLARAQDLARMGSFDWRRGQGGPVFSVEGAARVRPRPGRAAGVPQRCCAWCPRTTAAACVELLHEVDGAQLGAGHRRAGDAASTAASASSTSRPSPSSTSTAT